MNHTVEAETHRETKSVTEETSSHFFSGHSLTGSPEKEKAAGTRIGILDHTGPSLGGAQLVAGYLASILSRSYHVDLIGEWKEFGIEKIASAFALDLSRVRQRHYPGASAGFGFPGEYGLLRQFKRSRDLTLPYDLFIYSGHGAPPFCRARKGLVYCHFPFEASPDIETRQNPSWHQRNRLDRRIRRKVYQSIWRARMRSYDVILANSSFTADWIERRWGMHAETVYPPVDLTVPCATKENLIVSVGRFDGAKGRKGHLAQVEAFRKVVTTEHAWRLCLIGSCFGSQDQANVASLRQAAGGLPVEFAVNAERTAVSSLLAKAKIFWHTAGIDNAEKEKPYKAEHFGIATVEAMRAGCTPVVIASGGQSEIIQQGINGVLCRDMRELVEATLSLARNGDVLAAFGERARQRSTAFTGAAFERNIQRIVSRCLGMKET